MRIAARWSLLRILAGVSTSVAALEACGTSPADPSNVGAVDGSTPIDATSVDGEADDAGASALVDDAGGYDGAASPFCVSSDDAGLASSEWVYVGAGGKLTYKTLPRGDRILDYSYAGYGGGGAAIPSVPVAKMISPSGGDDTAAIQAAIDAVSAMPANNAIRGAVLLAAGAFRVQGKLSISTSGVVLRGSGSSTQGTVITLTGAPDTVLSIAGTGSWDESGASATITDLYVPSGAISFHVDDGSALAVGDAVLVDRPVTAAWIHFMGMDTLVRNGAPQTWLSTSSVFHADRSIAAISGNEITLDAPLSDSYDATYTPGSKVSIYEYSGRIAQVGVESIRFVAPSVVTAIDVPTFELLQMDAVVDGWVKDVAGESFVNGMTIGAGAKRVTVEGVSFVHTAAIDGSAGYPADFANDGQQILFSRCSSAGDHIFSFVSEAMEPGPNVVLNLASTGVSTNLSPHQRWATGILLDTITSPTGGIQLMNRGTAGSGQGWAVGFGVVWNSTADSLLIEQPPGSQNWAIGSTGTTDSTSTGAIDSPGHRVTPSSLYLAQLCERLGPRALGNIGY